MAKTQVQITAHVSQAKMAMPVEADPKDTPADTKEDPSADAEPMAVEGDTSVLADVTMSEA